MPPPAISASRSRPRFFAVGARVPHIASGVGAVATQALINPYYGIDGLKLLREGKSADEIVDDAERRRRGPRPAASFTSWTAAGRIAAYTGAECVDWCGHIARDDFSVAGNMLAGPAVIDETAAAYSAERALPFARRLIAAMRGGRGRGRRQARQAIGGAADLRRGGMVRSRPARRRPRRSAGRARAAEAGQPRALGAFPPNSCRAAQIPRGHRPRDHRAGIEAAIAAEQMTAFPLIAIENLRVVFHGDRGRTHRRGRRRRSLRRARADARHCRRIRLRQERHVARHHGAAAEGFGRGLRLGPLRRLRSARCLPDRPLRDLRGDRLAMIFQEPSNT